MDIKSKVIAIVAEVCEISPEEITVESSIGDFPTWDSMGHLAIIAKTEEVFDINFELDEMMDLEDVNDIIAAVEGKL